MRVLVVEDDTVKFGRISAALIEDGSQREDISLAVCVSDAIRELESGHFDLLLLDLNIPRRLGDAVQRGGGVEILRELSRSDALHRPPYVVGISAFDDAIAEFGSAFEDQLWSLVRFSETSDQWVSQLRSKASYIRANKRSNNFRDGSTHGTDLAIICALDAIEFEAVKALPCDWQPMRLAYDETRYLSGTASTSTNRSISVVAAAAVRMGMPTSSVLASKIIQSFRPRLIAMVGICAGRSNKVNIGDIIIGDPTWDWGSGKIATVDGAPQFLPAPHQLDIDPDIAATVKEIADDPAAMANIKSRAAGRKPAYELRAIAGPLASGAAVVADAGTFSGLVDQHRGLLGIDMEAYGVACAALGNGQPRPLTLICKSVCDHADEGKNDDYQQYAASVSALFALEAAKQILNG